MNSIRIPNGLFDGIPFPSCCYDCKHLNQDGDDYQFTCNKGRIFPFKKNVCTIFESVRIEQKKHGGKRQGAGRPKTDNPKIKWSGYLSPDVVHFLKVISKAQGYTNSQSDLINEAIRKYYYIHVIPSPITK